MRVKTPNPPMTIQQVQTLDDLKTLLAEWKQLAKYAAGVAGQAVGDLAGNDRQAAYHRGQISGCNNLLGLLDAPEGPEGKSIDQVQSWLACYVGEDVARVGWLTTTLDSLDVPDLLWRQMAMGRLSVYFTVMLRLEALLLRPVPPSGPAGLPGYIQPAEG